MFKIDNSDKRKKEEAFSSEVFLLIDAWQWTLPKKETVCLEKQPRGELSSEGSVLLAVAQGLLTWSK